MGHRLTHSSSVKAEPLSVISGGCCPHTLLFALHSRKKMITILPSALRMKAQEMYCKQISLKKGKDDFKSH